jgi:NitT/TauT family transport system substrate-binding protein
MNRLKETRMRKTLLAVPVLLLAAALLGSPPSQAQERKLRFGVMKIGALSNAYLAKEQGLFKKHGLDVELVFIRSGAEGVSALQGGNIEVTLAIPSFALAANERNFDLVMVMQNELAHAVPPDTGGIVVAKDSDIRKPSDLAGRTVGVNSLHAQEAVDAQYVIRKAGVPKDKIKYVEVPFPSMWDVLSRKQVDAAVAIDPFTTMMVQRGGRVIAWEYVDSIPEQPIGTFWAKRAWAEKNADLLERFTAAMEESIDYMNADAKRARGVVAEYTRLPAELVEAMPPIAWSSRISLAKWRELVELLRGMGELQSSPDPEKYFSAGVRRRLGSKE